MYKRGEVKINYRKYVPSVLLLLLVVLSLFIVKPFLKVVFFGALLAYVFYPLYKKLNLRINSTVSAFLICLIVLLILVVPSIFFIKTLIQETYVIFILIKQKLATGLFTNCHLSICEFFKSLGQDPEINYHIQNTAKSLTNWIVQKGSNFLVSIPRFIINLFVMFFTLFYFLKDGKLFLRKVTSYLNIHKNYYSRIMRRLKEIVHGITYGYLVIALIQGVTGALGFFIFGISSPVFWGLFMAFLALIPLVGAGLIWMPAAAILFINGILQNSSWLIVKGVLLFVYGMLFISSIDTFLKPKLMGHKAKIHPLITFLGIMGGLFVFGVLGVVIGPLLLSFTTVIIDTYLAKK